MITQTTNYTQAGVLFFFVFFLVFKVKKTRKRKKRGAGAGGLKKKREKIVNFVWTFSYSFIIGSEFFEIFRVIKQRTCWHYLLSLLIFQA